MESERPKIEDYLHPRTNNLHTQNYVDDLNKFIDQQDSQLKEKDVIISEYDSKMIADKESYFEIVELNDDLEKQLKEQIQEHEKNIKHLYGVLKERRDMCDKLEAEKKELINMLQGNLNDAYEGQFVMQEFIDEAAKLINKQK